MYEIGDYCKVKIKNWNLVSSRFNRKHYYKVIDIIETSFISKSSLPFLPQNIHKPSLAYKKQYKIRDLFTGEVEIIDINRVYGNPEKIKKVFRIEKLKRLI